MNEFLIQKYSLFVDKQCKSLLDNIIEVVDGSLSNESTLNTIKQPVQGKHNFKLIYFDSIIKLYYFIWDLEMLSNLSISDKLSCTVCNIRLFDRDEQVNCCVNTHTYHKNIN